MQCNLYVAQIRSDMSNDNSPLGPHSPLPPYDAELMQIGPWMRENYAGDDAERVAANAADAAADAAHAAAAAAARATEVAADAAHATRNAALRALSAAARQKNLHASHTRHKTPGGGGSKRKKMRKCKSKKTIKTRKCIRLRRAHK
jgi:hypothetical protein